ncbi:SHOCT domain-containing protein [Paenibacillus gansuensis]|uniref:SHOCT domain-containing protein n=1 Tax=Paenibacillus gansuensis TaxID=306542 RepID=A0ABW5P854_9BACL
MFYRGRVKPSKGASLLGMIVGGIFVIIGFTTVLPTFGWFGIVWTLFALGIAISHAVNFFGRTGVANWDVEMQVPSAPTSTNDFESKLRKLEKLKQDGLISDEEYEDKRSQILNDIW